MAAISSKVTNGDTHSRFRQTAVGLGTSKVTRRSKLCGVQME